MIQQIPVADIYDKSINFIIGSGASADFLPTLSLHMNDSKQHETIENLITKFDNDHLTDLSMLLSMYYYKKCIEPALSLSLNTLNCTTERLLENYTKFIRTILIALLTRGTSPKRCNLFTTNYDGFIPLATERLLREKQFDFILNDGTSGFQKQVLDSKNFDRKTMYTGIFERHQRELPQINLINLHGSVYWYKDTEGNIEVDYNATRAAKRAINFISDDLETFSRELEKSEAAVRKLHNKVDVSKAEKFLDSYSSLPIINPRKSKFHETVIEEHYYQMLRYLSYQLEEKNSIVIVFGFSFKDEHIRNLLKRSLSNPTLKVFVCCFNEADLTNCTNFFRGFTNVEYVKLDEDMTFSCFNDSVFHCKHGISVESGESV